MQNMRILDCNFIHFTMENKNKVLPFKPTFITIHSIRARASVLSITE
jgi:hypothetical protein